LPNRSAASKAVRALPVIGFPHPFPVPFRTPYAPRSASPSQAPSGRLLEDFRIRPTLCSVAQETEKCSRGKYPTAGQRRYALLSPLGTLGRLSLARTPPHAPKPSRCITKEQALGFLHLLRRRHRDVGFEVVVRGPVPCLPPSFRDCHHGVPQPAFHDTCADAEQCEVPCWCPVFMSRQHKSNYQTLQHLSASRYW
jgi:hypothetical protein